MMRRDLLPSDQLLDSPCPAQPARAPASWARLYTLAALAALLTIACTSRAESPALPATAAGGNGSGQGNTGSPIPVSTASVVEEAMTESLQAVGNVEARATVEVHAQVTGQVVSIGFAEGNDVTVGQMLFRIDPRPFQAALDQAEATLAKDAAQAINAGVTADRSETLFAKGLISTADLQAAQATRSSLDAAVHADAAQVETAKLQLQYTTMTAPVSGRTGALLVHPGALIRANDTNPMVVINQITPVYVSFAVPSPQLEAIRTEKSKGGLRVSAHVAGSPSPASTGAVSFIDNVVDPSTDTIRLKATFPNTDHRLWPGQFVEISVELALDPHAIVAPAAAVQPAQTGTFAYVVKPDGTVEARSVIVARTQGSDSVIQSGLHVGDVVVTDGQLQLTPGARVSIKPAVAGTRTP
jgi:multidrug efflux system membrane fusion protein